MRAAPVPLLVRRLGRVAYETALAEMRAFTQARALDTADELWLLEHPPVYTRGNSARAEHGPRAANAVPVVTTDRGGGIAYHGPGQAIVYTLVDLGRRGLGVRRLVAMLEDAAIALLARHGVAAARRPGAPGVYVAGAKIAFLGLRVSRGRVYHGLAFNVDLDLVPYAAIDPCGQAGLAVTHARALGLALEMQEAQEALAEALARSLADG